MEQGSLTAATAARPRWRAPRVLRPLIRLRSLRQFLVLLVIPPLVFRPDGRGLHDMAAGSAVVRLETLRAAGQ